MGLRMPFGKHKGTPIENLPLEYLDWILDWMDEEGLSHSKPRLFDALDEEFMRRKKGSPPEVSGTGLPKLSPQAKALLPLFVKAGYHAMALKLHPDRGGTNEQMVALQQLKEALEKL